MPKRIVIVGITGGQGGSVARALLSNSIYKIRGITRNTQSPSAKALTVKGIDLVTADLDDQSSLIAAFAGAHAIFAVTDFYAPFQAGCAEHAMKIEYAQGTNMVRAALKTPTLEHFVWSTLVDSEKISNGKYMVPHFSNKARVDELIKSFPELLAKTSFLWVP